MKNLDKKGTGILVCLTVFLFATAYSIYGVLMPDMKQAYGLSVSQSGLIGQFQYIGELCALVFAGFFINKFHKKTLLYVLLFLFSALLAGLSAGMGFQAVVLLFMGMGMCAGVVNLTSSCLMAEGYPEGRGKALNIMHGVFGAGSMAGPLLPALLAGQWYVTYRLLAVVIFIYAALLACYVIVNTRVRRKAAQAPDVTAADRRASQAAAVSSGGKSYLSLLGDRRLLALFLLLVLCNGQQCGFTMWIPSFMRGEGVENIVCISLTVSLYNVGNAASRLLFPVLAGRARENLLLTGGTLAGAFVLALGTLTVHPWGMVAAGAMAGFLTGIVMPTLLGRACDLYPDRNGEVTTLMCMACSLGAIVVPWLCGQLMELAGGRVGIQTLVCCLVLIGLAGMWSERSGNDKRRA